ncbi:cell division topological specificity factor MinE [Amphibiibacter pelophylacis]|uniref:Cell division topological specificity factor MinE n=1 Tax=Amphibiibacter pelophylacis TaxID=1799477 RepID=A0ACC6P3E9_9BURK
MSFLDFFRGEKKKSASLAKERLQIILTHERNGHYSGRHPDYLPELQKELVAVIRKYIQISDNDIVVDMSKQDDLDVLQVKIELPERR